MRITTHSMIVLLSLVTSTLEAESFRGLPYLVKVDSVTIRGSEREAEPKLVDVCYRFSTSPPLFDYSDFASKSLRGIPVKAMPNPAYGDQGDPQDAGIPFHFSVFGFDVVAYVDSSPSGFDVSNMDFFNSAVRSVARIPKPLHKVSFATTFRSMIYPQYEWIRTCERIPFGSAYSDAYITKLFTGPGPIGHIAGGSSFAFRLFPPSFLGIQPVTISLNSSDYVVPIFGLNALSEGDMRMLSLSHFINSLNTLRANLDEQVLNNYLAENRNLVAKFEAHYHVSVALPLDSSAIVALLHQINGIESPQ